MLMTTNKLQTKKLLSVFNPTVFFWQNYQKSTLENFSLFHFISKALQSCKYDANSTLLADLYLNAFHCFDYLKTLLNKTIPTRRFHKS